MRRPCMLRSALQSPVCCLTSLFPIVRADPPQCQNVVFSPVRYTVRVPDKVRQSVFPSELAAMLQRVQRYNSSQPDGKKVCHGDSRSVFLPSGASVSVRSFTRAGLTLFRANARRSGLQRRCWSCWSGCAMSSRKKLRWFATRWMTCGAGTRGFSLSTSSR